MGFPLGSERHALERRLIVLLLPVATLVACGADEAVAPGPANAGGAGNAGGSAGIAGVSSGGGAGQSAGGGRGPAGSAGSGAGLAGAAGASGDAMGGAAGTDTLGFGGSSHSAGGAGKSGGLAGKAGAAGAAGVSGQAGAAGSGGASAGSGTSAAGAAGDGGAAADGGAAGTAGQGAGGGEAGGAGVAGAAGAGAAGGAGAGTAGNAGSAGAGGGIGGSAGAGTTYPACTGVPGTCGASLSATVKDVCEVSGKVGIQGAADCAFVDTKSGDVEAFDELGRSWGKLKIADLAGGAATVTPPAGAPGKHRLVLHYVGSGGTCELARIADIETRPSPDVSLDKKSGAFKPTGSTIPLLAGSSDPLAKFSWTYPFGGGGALSGKTVTFAPSTPAWATDEPLTGWKRTATVTATAVNGCTASASYDAIVFGCGAETRAAGVDVVPAGTTQIVGTLDQKVDGVVVCGTANATAGPYVGAATGGYRQRVWVGANASFTIPAAHTGRVLLFVGKGATVKIDGQGQYAIVAATGSPAPVFTGTGAFQRVDCGGYAPPAGASFSPALPAGCL